jgi:hypothetical protein
MPPQLSETPARMKTSVANGNRKFAGNDARLFLVLRLSAALGRARAAVRIYRDLAWHTSAPDRRVLFLLLAAQQHRRAACHALQLERLGALPPPDRESVPARLMRWALVRTRRPAVALWFGFLRRRDEAFVRAHATKDGTFRKVSVRILTTDVKPDAKVTARTPAGYVASKP